MKMLDLFSGWGGASEAMLQNGWDVIRIENNPELALVPNTHLMCIYDLGQLLDIQMADGYIPSQPELIWASPPCTNNPENAIELVKEAKRIIDIVNPRYWIIQNVQDSIKYLTPILGEPTMIIDSIVLWGRFPKWSMPPHYKHIKDDLAQTKIPYEVSNACRQSIENTRTLDYWF